MRWVRELGSNPFFRRGVKLRQTARRAALLAAVNTLYVLAFFVVYCLQVHHPASPGARLTRDFSYEPWLAAGALLLSLCAHWLVPPFVLRSIPGAHDLDVLNVLVRERRRSEDVLRGHVAASAAPLCLGVLPLGLTSALLLVFGTRYGLAAPSAVLGAALWGTLCATVSAWVAAGGHPFRWAALRSYGWTCAVLPVVIGVMSVTVARGCCADLLPPRQAVVFPGAVALVWTVLVTGCAAAFWDLAQRRFFPEKQRSLWVEAEGAVSEE